MSKSEGKYGAYRAEVPLGAKLLGRWAGPILLNSLLLAPRHFAEIAFWDVTQRLFAMASFLIPLKLLFLLSSGAREFQVPGFGAPIHIGQFEVTLLVLPIALMPLLSHYIGKMVQRKREGISENILTRYEVEKPLDKKVKTAIDRYSRIVSDSSLAVFCFLIMFFILPGASLILGICFLASLYVTRYRIKQLYERGVPPAGSDGSQQQNMNAAVQRISRSTQASLQLLLLPVFVYLMSGELLEGRVDLIFAVAFVLLFRFVVTSSQTAVTLGVQYLDTLRHERALLALLTRRSIRC